MGLKYGQETTTTTTTTTDLLSKFQIGGDWNYKSTNMPSSIAAEIRAPNLHETLGPLLPALPAASVSPTPAEAILPLLSPILRQRVQLLSSSDTDSWLDYLCYDKASVPRLREVARGDRLELHPVSGEVEVDWDYDAETRYRRLDEETLQALVALRDMGLSFRLVYCTGGEDGDAWKVGEVTVTEKASPFASFGGAVTIAEAERRFAEEQRSKAAPPVSAPPVSAPTNGYSYSSSRNYLTVEDEEDDDDDYWARYDATPSRTPAMPRSPAPQSTTANGNGHGPLAAAAEEDDYYAQYDQVQPAMDNYDPDEDANKEVEKAVIAEAPPPPLGLARPEGTDAPSSLLSNGNGEAAGNEANGTTQASWTVAEPTPQHAHAPSFSLPSDANVNPPNGNSEPEIVHPHPRPPSSASSRASVERLEAAAEKRDQSEFGVKQHVSRSVKSLYMLARASGIDRQEFERLVRTELDMLGLMEE